MKEADTSMSEVGGAQEGHRWGWTQTGSSWEEEGLPPLTPRSEGLGVWALEP